MRVKLNSGFRQRDYANQIILGSRVGVKSLSINEIRRIRYKLNYSNFKSERWFINLLNDHIKIDTVVYRNFPILNRYFADLFFKDLGIVVEIDGSSHNGKQEYDNHRDLVMIDAGYRVFRCKFLDLENALRIINIANNSKPYCVTKKLIIPGADFEENKGTFINKNVNKKKQLKRAILSWKKAGLDVDKISSWFNK